MQNDLQAFHTFGVSWRFFSGSTGIDITQGHEISDQSVTRAGKKIKVFKEVNIPVYLWRNNPMQVSHLTTH